MTRTSSEQRATPPAPPSFRRANLTIDGRFRNTDRRTYGPAGACVCQPSPRARSALGCARAPDCSRHRRTYANPVLDADFPDPAVIRAPDGFYYAYATQTRARRQHGSTSRSRARPTWSTGSISAMHFRRSRAGHRQTQDFWAPHVHQRWRALHHVLIRPSRTRPDERHGLCLAVATASSPAGPFVDMGHPLKCGAGFVNIDPMAFDDPATGKHLLYWGSGFEPIKVQELGPDRMSFAPGSRPRIWSGQAGQGAPFRCSSKAAG